MFNQFLIIAAIFITNINIKYYYNNLSYELMLLNEKVKTKESYSDDS